MKLLTCTEIKQIKRAEFNFSTLAIKAQIRLY